MFSHFPVGALIRLPDSCLRFEVAALNCVPTAVLFVLVVALKISNHFAEGIIAVYCDDAET
jgi:hypothetical protein